MIEKIRLIGSSIRKRGLANTLLFVCSDLIFDIIYKTDTVGFKELNTLQIDSENKKYGVRYQPSNYFLLKLFFYKFSDHIKNSVFLDFGSGKGRVLLMSALYGASKSIGVEFSRELIDVADKNIKILSCKKKFDTKFELLNIDATIFTDMRNVNIFFFYNPFDERIMRQVLSNILEYVLPYNQNIMLAYVNPVYKELFYENGFIDIWSYGNDIIVFRAK